MKASSRVIVNTTAQFTKTFIGGIITLYSSRLILLSLGDNDFGIYSLLAGIILMLSFVTNALATSTQRFISYYHHHELKAISSFSNSVFLHVILGFFAILLFLSLIPFLFNGFLNITPNRISSAKFVYITVVISVFISFITSPYRAILISHENIVYISFIEILDTILKLIIAISLNYIFIDKLNYYGLALMCIQIFNFLCIFVYTSKKYRKSTLIKFSLINKKELKHMASFTGWNMYVLGCNIGRTQGLSIVLNKFLGTVMNAAYGIGLQLSSYVNYMSESLLNSLRPQIIKAEGIGDRTYMFNLSCTACKMSFFILSWISIPCIVYMPKILEIWLKEPPIGAITFCRMFMLAGLADSLTIGLHIANQAIGNLKKFVLCINTLKLSVLPISILLLYYDANIKLVATVYVFMEFITAILRIFLLSKDGLRYQFYFSCVLVKIIIPLVIVIGVNVLTKNVFHLQFVLSSLISLSLYGFSIYIWGLTLSERDKIITIVRGLQKKIRI